jgi:hypothetical protein
MVTWDQIAAECDGYRAGFVAVFRAYEGMPTDETDAYGRVVKVTVTSFAEHVGIPRQTFQRWIKGGADGARVGHDLRGSVTRSGQIGRQIAKSPSVDIEDKVGMLRDLMSDKEVLRAWREQREPIVSNADAKAAEAWASAITAPLVEAADRLIQASEQPLSEAWRDWACQQNTLFMRGARLEARTEQEGVELDGYAALARLFYQRLTARTLDLELEQLLRDGG